MLSLVDIGRACSCFRVECSHLHGRASDDGLVSEALDTLDALKLEI